VNLLGTLLSWLGSYWRWTTDGSKWRLGAGIGGPILALLILIAAVSGGDQGAGSTGSRAERTASPPRATVTATATPPSSAAEEEAAEDSGSPSGAAASAPLPAVEPGQGQLVVYFIDVSLGDAIYVRTPSGEDLIIDGGDSRNELSAFLDQLGETALDVVIASHPHADHIGGLPRVVSERHIGTVWTNGETYTTNLYRDLEAAITASGATRHVGKVGDAFTLGGVTFAFLAPARLGSNINDNSLVVRMDCGPSSFLFTGDAETGAENEMIVTGQNLDVDVLKIGHHGSRTSTSSQFILATSPRLAIYQARPGNQYGHPHQETLSRLAAAGVPTFGTGAAGGTVVVATACDDQFSVSPQFGGFATIPAPAASQPSPSAGGGGAPIEPTAPPAAPTTPPPTVGPAPPSDCHPSYQGGTDRDRGGCIRVGLGDYDCWPGSGNGPNYVIGPVTVVGTDEFALDTNDPDNIGCESG